LPNEMRLLGPVLSSQPFTYNHFNALTGV